MILCLHWLFDKLGNKWTIIKRSDTRKHIRERTKEVATQETSIETFLY